MAAAAVWPNNAVNTIVVYSKPDAAWGNGNTSTSGWETTLTKPDSCPAPTYVVTCAAGGSTASVVVTFTKSGGTTAIPFEITSPLANPTPSAVNFTVPANGSTNITFDPVASGSFVVQYKAQNIQQPNLTIPVSCTGTPGTPTNNVVCAENGETATVTVNAVRNETSNVITLKWMLCV